MDLKTQLDALRVKFLSTAPGADVALVERMLEELAQHVRGRCIPGHCRRSAVRFQRERGQYGGDGAKDIDIGRRQIEIHIDRRSLTLKGSVQ